MKHYLHFLCLLLVSLQTACAQHDIARPWDQDVIYFALTDRFFDGDASNNRPPESDPALYDPTQSDMDLYHGGDFRGLEIALDNGYFNALGITAIWITPPVRNVWYAAFDSKVWEFSSCTPYLTHHSHPQKIFTSLLNHRCVV